MKFVNFRHGGAVHYGAVDNGRIVDLTDALGDRYPDLIAFIQGGDEALVLARRQVDAAGGAGLDYEQAELLSVVTDPGKIVCVGLNYHDHVAEASAALGGREVPQQPMIFARWKESLVPHRGAIQRPRVSHHLDWEAELLVVIGKTTGRYVTEANALDHVFGYSCFNDGSIRDYQFHTRQIGPGKNFEATGGNGPWLVTADEIPDPQNLQVQMRLNGQVMQDANTSNMVFTVAQIIAYVSQWIPLQPGDLIASGTMGGVGFSRKPPIFMQPTDRAEIMIEGIGTLVNTVRDE
ncbi:fumarylacetoacetate hydrolase family protein [Paracidovorax cattleyae]|uniref:2-keto-4-pentenoate hydratase/2-oxohepta-3-ene-1,7-dioic acid hydratase (Catechol pathway) n=1 Tax=Paracidovorax cattleyae TaxID=80868 RepID=A0A1H0WAS0_9BURK|nr:fumarylacetoacetate hydrolase family protein [Paracidovorax cattleyae]SDP87794.1 2-keto-4-pentenoate hydratase/2-oxohepta-3-ene-1,7-dioic acid hydratase (catechol pathway) [Paracidovorax cattleyae]